MPFAGGGSWYSKTLAMLEPGARVWVNLPGTGYIGVCEVEEPMQPVDEFMVSDDKTGKQVSLIDISPIAASLNRAADDPEKADYLVRVRWLKTTDPNQAIREKGFLETRIQ